MRVSFLSIQSEDNNGYHQTALNYLLITAQIRISYYTITYDHLLLVSNHPHHREGITQKGQVTFRGIFNEGGG